jgi:hypothetical protein
MYPASATNEDHSQGTFMVNWARIIIAVLAAQLVTGCNQQQFSLPSESQNFGEKITYSKEVDVLWVIDTSGSMGEHQGLLAAQVGTFVESLNATGLDYHMAVTTMDMSATGLKGHLLAKDGTPAVLTPATPNLVSVLSERLQPGEDGSPIERGQEAMKAALTMTSAGQANQGFLRDNALLVVIFLTNEEDESAQTDYAAYLDQLKPALKTGERSWIAHFMGVIHNETNCQTAKWGYSSPGTRYMRLAKASGGASESICDADLRRALTNVKIRVIEIATEYALSGDPNVSSIKVYVNGVLVPQDGENGWTYIKETNSIRFHGTAIPGQGSNIRVDFDPGSLGD